MAMDKIPQECRGMISSFLTKQDRLNLSLTCKKFYNYFDSTNWREVKFCGYIDHLSPIFKFFLDEKYDEKHKRIRKATIHIQGWSKSYPSSADPIKLLVDSLSKMVEVKEIILYDERRFCLPINGAQFARILTGTPRWNTVTTLCLECSTPIALAALNHCDRDVLKSVSLNAWSQSINDTSDEYLDLRSMYSAQPQSLKALSLCFKPHSEHYNMGLVAEEYIDGVHQTVKDFPGLKHLYIHGSRLLKHCKRLGPLDEPFHQCYWYFDSDVDRLCQALNSSNVEHFAIGLNLDCFDDEFLALSIAIGVQGQSEAECEHLFDENDYVDDSLSFDEDDLVQWNVNLTNRIIACPNLRTVRVYYESSGQCYCPACRRGLGACIYGYRLDNGGTFTELREGE
ncbi:hypothetical protein NXS19_001147 [Fusarium pseudograminearum]|nr:hypothetical protein NXS19_001147 [Fusarium pseudograminearum]